MKLVQFKNGKWAIERGYFFKEYLDKDSLYYWTTDYAHKYCLFDTKEKALEHLKAADLRVIKREKL